MPIRRAKKLVRHVFVIKVGHAIDAPCYIIKGSYFKKMIGGRKDINMRSSNVQPTADKILKEFVRAKQSRAIEWCEDEVMLDTSTGSEFWGCNICPVVLFVNPEETVLLGQYCVDLESDPLHTSLLPRVRRLRLPQTAVKVA